MAIIPTLLLLLLLESLAALTLATTTARLRLVGDRHQAAEAAIALEQAVTGVRLEDDSLLAAWPAATAGPLPVPVLPGWEVTADAEREGNAPVVRLRMGVLHRGPAGDLRAARAATLLLITGAADTAIVLDNRPGF